MKIKSIFFIFSFCAIVYSCTKDQANPIDTSSCNTEDVSFATDIFPIIETKCSSDQACHIAGAAVGDFTSYNAMLEDLDNGKIELRALVSKNMPPDWSEIEPLDECEVLLLQTWINNDYPEN